MEHERHGWSVADKTLGIHGTGKAWMVSGR